MAEVERYAKELAEVAKLIGEAGNKAKEVCGWPLEQLVSSYLSMYERFCPFGIGDRVILRQSIDFANAPGWRGSQHWLKPGAVGTVRERGYSGSSFTFAVEFDDESWKDSDDVVHPITDRHTFSFKEHFLVKA
jgi:hypothetical protein